MRWSRRKCSIWIRNPHLQKFGIDLRSCYIQLAAQSLLQPNNLLPCPLWRNENLASGLKL